MFVLFVVSGRIAAAVSLGSGRRTKVVNVGEFRGRCVALFPKAGALQTRGYFFSSFLVSPVPWVALTLFLCVCECATMDVIVAQNGAVAGTMVGMAGRGGI